MKSRIYILGGTISDNEAATRYVAYGPGLDEVLASVHPTTNVKTYAHQDGLGSVVAQSLSGSSPTVTGTYTYGQFGETNSLSGFPYRYTGRNLDFETGLYHYRARAYSPAIGRFMQPDPIGYDGGPNLYAYVGNDPLNKTDPSGLTWQDTFQMFGAWVTGTAPAHQVFGPGTNQAQDMMNASGVNAARGEFYEKNVGRSVNDLLPVNNFDAHFGASGYVQAGLNPTQQYVGSYRVDITPDSKGMA